MAQRTFTLDEANAALRELRPVAERMVDLQRRRREAAARVQELRARIGSNGGGIGATDAEEAERGVERLRAALVTCVELIVAAGVQVKDVDSGLLDFPSVREGRIVLLCWRVGEDEITHWHGVDEGFAGRKPVDPVE